MNRVLSAVAVAIFSVCVVSWQLQAGVVNITQGSTSGYTMTDGNTYVIQNSVTFSNSTAGGSGMSVADNATVVLYVPAGVTLTARGANGSGRTGGGAGIRVPETATLIITGEGTVNVTGGNAGNGGNGANGGLGTDVSVRLVGGSSYWGTGNSGAGGRGGIGGGGAGAAIGGSGGSGGNGGSGGESVVSEDHSCNSFSRNGNDGMSGYAGSAGKGMGKCYVLGTTSIEAIAGVAGIAGNAGDFAALSAIKRVYRGSVGYDPSEYFATCGGGGGGGGGAGCAPSNTIGGGGAAGGGGGGGGSGATAARNSDYYGSYPLANAHGGGGTGGKSNIIPGETGADKEKTKGGSYESHSNSTFQRTYYYGGDGGAGGGAGAEGGAGTLYVSPTATVNVNRTKLSATTHSSAQYTIIFNANGGQFSSAVESLTATLGCVLPDCIPAPTRRGYLFDGWRTAAGEEYYGTSGAKSMSSYPVVGNVTLYAQWQVDETYVDHTVTTPEEVPYSYFDNNYPTLLAEHGGDYEAAALATAANGHNKVWECYVTGLCPTNETSSFVAKIEMVDGMPIVTWDPDLNTNGVVRTYKVYGKETLEAAGEWQYPTNSLHRFFKVEVGLP